MKETCLALLALSCASTVVRAQEQARAPKLLVQAAQCLAAKEFLPPLKATALRLGYLVDTKSYPGEKVLYLVDYIGSGRSEGLVFAVFLSRQDGRRVFNIQNNAKFAKSKDGMRGIRFVEDPRGGTWTQEHLVSAIKQIERQPVITVRVKDLLTLPALTKCESYADKK